MLFLGLLGVEGSLFGDLGLSGSLELLTRAERGDVERYGAGEPPVGDEEEETGFEEVGGGGGGDEVDGGGGEEADEEEDD